MIFENQKKFGLATKQELKETRQFTCEDCGKKFSAQELEIHHHHVWKSEAKRYEIPGKFVACKENGKVLCPSCHDKLHREIPARPTEEIIHGIIAIAKITNQGKEASQVIAKISRRYRD